MIIVLRHRRAVDHVETLALHGRGVVSVHTVVPSQVRAELELLGIVQDHVPTVSDVAFAIHRTVREYTCLGVARMIATIYSVCFEGSRIPAFDCERSAFGVVVRRRFADQLFVVPYSVRETPGYVQIVSVEGCLRNIFHVHLFVNVSPLTHCFVVIHVDVVLQLSRIAPILDDIFFEFGFLQLKMRGDLVHVFQLFLVLRYHSGVYRRFRKLLQQSASQRKLSLSTSHVARAFQASFHRVS